MFVDDLLHLEIIGTKVHETNKWHYFGAYCTLRGKGLRKKALEALCAFIASIESESFEKRKEFVSWIIDTSSNTGFNLSILNVGFLFRDVINPTLREWISIEETAKVHVLLFEYDGCSLEHLERAIEIDPNFIMAREKLCHFMMDHIS